MPSDVLDAAYELMADTAPEFGPGFANHGPMAAEALVRLGHESVVPPFIESYLARLSPDPGPGRPLDEGEWEDSLGSFDWWPNWRGLFEAELAEAPFGEVLAKWVPRLAPGMIGAAAHGLIRTAHAARAVEESDNPVRRRELALGLAYWAARYQELPGPPVLLGPLDVPGALLALPYLRASMPEEFLITNQVRHLDQVSEEFEAGVVTLAEPSDPYGALVDLAVGGASAYLLNAPQGDVIALVHSVTAPLALSLLLAHLGEEDRATALSYGWQAVAALHSIYADHRGSVEVGETPYPEEIAAKAAYSGDEHAIKLAEACLRAYRTSGDSVLLSAAADAAVRLGA